MTTDTATIILAAGSTALFMAAHIAVLRRTASLQVIKWLAATYFSAGTVSALSAAAVFQTKVVSDMAENPQAAVVSITTMLAIYTLCVFIYIICVFGLVESSIRIRILEEIAGHRGGLTQRGILMIYNRNTIITKRIRRFLASGEIICLRGRYYPRSAVTVFSLPAAVLGWMWKWYRGTNELS